MADLSHQPDQTGRVLPAPLLPPPLPTPRRGRLGWLGHLLLLSGWIVALIVLWFVRKGSSEHPHTPLHSVRGVLLSTGLNTLIFGAVCGAAWLCSRATASEWRLRWRGGAGPLWRGVLYSVALRIAMFVVTVAVAAVLIACHVIDANDVERLKPHVENAISLSALVHDRAFYWGVVTLLSASAGVLEEIWRGGMLAGLAGAFPRAFGGPVGSWLAIIPVAVLFGCAHLYMGAPAVVLTTLIGLALGAMTVWHRTIWDAVFAHALFDAGSFALLAWAVAHDPRLFNL